MGSTYKKLENGDYEVTSDSGGHKVTKERVGLDVQLSNVRRVASRGVDNIEPEKGINTKRNILASWLPDEHHFELISEEGERRVNLPMGVYVAIGDPAFSRISHWIPRDSAEELNLSIYLAESEFDWLWNEIGQRPSAIVSARFDATLLLAGIEASMYYDVPFNPVRIEHKGRTGVENITFTVSDPEPDKPGPTQQDQMSFVDRLEKTFDSATMETWLKWIFWLLLAITAILIFKH